MSNRTSTQQPISSTAAPLPSSHSSSSSSSSSSRFISRNHPDQLKQLPLPKYDPNYSLKSYLSGAETLLDKAKGNDAAGQLVEAFQNYRKAAAIIGFCPETKEFQQTKAKADQTWQRFKTLRESITEIVSRCKRIEDQLIERETQHISALNDRSNSIPSQDHQVSPSTSTSTSIPSPPTTSPKQLSGIKKTHRDDSFNLSGDSNQPNSLAARLASLRNFGVDSETTSAGNKRMSKNGFGDLKHGVTADSSRDSQQINSGSSSRTNGNLQEDREREREVEGETEIEEDEEENRKHLENLRLVSGSPQLSSKHDNFSIHKVTEDLRRDVAEGRDIAGELGYSRGDETPEHNESTSYQTDDSNGNQNQNDYGNDGIGGERFPHIPTASEFNSQYPTLDDFEKDEDSKSHNPSNNQFPSIPTHSVGSSSNSSSGRAGPSRPLPHPPTKPDTKDFNLVRDVPQSWTSEESSNFSRLTTSTSTPSNSQTIQSTSIPTTSDSSSQNRNHRISRPPPPIPSSTKPNFIPSSNSNSSSLPMPGSGLGETGSKPNPPSKPFISVEELYQYLYPGFEKQEVEPGISKLVTRVGLEILLLDVRNRDEFENGRIKAKNVICLEPLILKEGISCEEIEDRLLISPYEEQINWDNRANVDLVVIYDEKSRNFETGGSDERERINISRLNILYQSLVERNFKAPLKNKPVILIGGMDRWSRHARESSITRDRREVNSNSHNSFSPSMNGNGNQGVNGNYSSNFSSSSSTNPPKAESPSGGRTRYSTAYESGQNFSYGGPKESPDSRSSLDLSRNRMNNFDDSSSSEETKKARRQVHIGPNGINQFLSNPSASNLNPSIPNPYTSSSSSSSTIPSSLPASLIPARSPNSVSSPFQSSSFANLGTGLSMPARAYQSGGPSSTSSHSTPTGVTTPSGRMRASDDYFQQPHETYGSISTLPSMPTPSRQNSLGHSNFDYPTLSPSSSNTNQKSNPYQISQQPISNHHHHSHSNSISSSQHHHQQQQQHSLSPLPTAAIANGISARAPHTSSTANPSPSSGSRSPIPANPNQSNPSSSTELSKRPIPTQSLSNIPNRGYYGQIGHIDQQIHIGMTGLKNVGNSCYMNSTLQCLSASLPLANFMLTKNYERAINKTNPLGTSGALAKAFAGLINVLWSEQYTFVSPVTFREAILKFAPSFRGYDQHDSQEFLVFLLDGLHEDLNYVVNKPPPIEVSKERELLLETLPQQIASVQEWEIYRRRNNSIIVDQFQGQFRNKMTCLTCGTTSTTYNAFVNLSLPIPSGKGITKVTLQQCLDAFVKEEVMDKADAWNCPKCKKPRKATKRLSISRLPKLLLIHLKRFSFKGPFTDKIETKVDFPKQGLDLTNYMPSPLPPSAIKANRDTPISVSQQPPYLYDLYAVTHHFGSLNTGHYTATIRNDGAWWYYDDSVVSRKDERHLNTNSPYVLWFRRRMG